ncbi:DUF3017 domain-containing protein [Streptomyces sp. A7024]|uniref:DUF3017 domain-containing protein n=1 Tax=Streptomyces coryli TaxID=1128680 RepID=A0A6G4U8A6_9ACTN|nr:DUF3017 domain-containing protein [Streptomyces coryli]
MSSSEAASEPIGDKVGRGTRRPEGGGRTAGGDAPAPARQWPLLSVLGAVAVGLLITTFDHFRPGCIIIGAALLGAGVLRWMLPNVGMLAVRSRFTDVVTYWFLGAAIIFLTLLALPALISVPFLDDVLHFTL